MKKLLALILCLMLAFSTCAMAATTAVDFGTFTIDLGPNDQYEVADTMTDGQLYALISPNYDPNATFTSTINVVWTSGNLRSDINTLGGMDAYAQLVMNNANAQYSEMGIVMSNYTLMRTFIDDETAGALTSYTLDYTKAGVDMVTNLYQMQALFFNGANDNYIFTLTAYTIEELEVMSAYLDTVTFKAAAQAAAPAADRTTVDFGTFTMEVGVNDYYEVADTMSEGAAFLILYPDYLTTGQTTNNLNAVHTEENLALQLLLVGGIENYGKLVLQQTVPQYEAVGIKMTNPQLLYAATEDDLGVIIISSDLDYSGAGIDLTLTLYQMIGMFMNTSSGSYVFTLTAESMDALQEMSGYLDSVQFK